MEKRTREESTALLAREGKHGGDGTRGNAHDARSRTGGRC
jgi:hypothetical protein